ncbi:TPA: hypothetical protein QCR75_005748 [Bacillus anthracis]|nr:hypothetical protein [Bacillus anthracis]
MKGDEFYHQQVIDEDRTSHLDVSINGLAEIELLSTDPLDVELIRESVTKKVIETTKRLLKSEDLTQVQGQRFMLHF